MWRHNLGKIFLSKNLEQNVVEKLVPDPFLKNQNQAYLRTNSLKFYTVCFYCVPKSRTTKRCFNDDLPLPHVKLFYETKRGLEMFSLPHFLHDFWRKIFPMLYLVNSPNLIIWMSLLLEMLANMCIIIAWPPDCEHKFGN